MKITKFGIVISIVSVALIMVTLTACDFFDDIDNVTIPSELESVVPVNITETTTDTTFSYSKVIGLTDDPEVQKYKDKLKDVRLEKITVRVEDYEARGEDVILKSPTLSFSCQNGTVSVRMQDLNLKEATTDIVLDEVNQQTIDIVSGFLRDVPEVNVEASGTLSSTPVSCKLVFTIYSKVTAEALD